MSTGLKTYQQKRNFKKTSEPSGSEGQKSASRKSNILTFVIQKHDASRLHYDFRLEADGRLISWAVPKGPSLSPSQKRLAVHVEDHPLDYASFEGSIPKGEYGGGEVAIWDKGTYFVEGLEGQTKAAMSKAVLKGVASGKLKIIISGDKIQGGYSLVQLRNSETDKNWLLIKGDDDYANDDVDVTADTPKKSDRTSVAKKSTAKTIAPTEKTPKKVSPKQIASKQIQPMLASLAAEAFSKEGWVFEPKFDGIRVIAYIFEKQVMLLSRNGMNITAKFPSIVEELQKLKSNMIIDGEIVALNDQGVPSFEALQARSLLKSKGTSASGPAIKYYVFDILQIGSDSLLQTPLKDRLLQLKKNVFVKTNKNVLVVEAYQGDGKKAYATAIREGMEGIVAKALDSTYSQGKRSPNWLKIKNNHSSEFVICGYSAGVGAREGALGALIIAERQKNGTLKYAGKVGTGFNTTLLKSLTKQLNSLKVSEAPVVVTKEYTDKTATWVKPKLVAEIKYAEKTKQGLLRAPVFMHLREDIDADQIVEEALISVNKIAVKKMSAAKATKSVKIESENTAKPKKGLPKANLANSTTDNLIAELDAAGESLVLSVGDFQVKFSHLNKVLWPKAGKQTITKRDYVRYLLTVSPYLLNHLHDRPFTLIRMPDGITGQRFFQKHQPANSTPDFLETVEYYSDHAQSDGEFLLCNNLATLIWCGQMAGLELHASHTRITPDKNLTGKTTGSLKNVKNSVANYPDFLVLDLDPYLYSGKEKEKEEPQLHKKGFEKTCQSALWLKEILDELKLNAFVKTSGRTGLHIYVPIERNLPYDAVRSCCETLGRHLLAAHPKDITMEWSISKRPGKIFFDHNMNGRGKTLPAPYSLRATAEATASMPISWEEIENIYPPDFTILTVPEILIEKGDIWHDILQHRNDLKKKLNL